MEEYTMPIKDGGSSSYGATAVSTPDISHSFHTQEDASHTKLNRSASVGPGMDPSALNPRQKGRRAVYVELPFYSMYGMQYREHKLAKSHSRAHLDSMEGISDKDKMLGEVDVDDVIVTWPLIAAVLIAAGLMFNVGYNLGVMNAPESVVFPGHTTTEWSLAVSVLAIGGPFGAIAAGGVSNKRGRRVAILLNAWVFLIGGIIFSLAPNIYSIILGRVIVGFASGFSCVVVPIYLGELAPPTLRGTLGTLTQFAMVTGILASNLLAFPLATSDGWRYLFAVGPILSGVQILCAPFIYESPRWMLNRDEYSMAARVAIKRLRGIRDDEEVQIEIDHIVEASKKQKLRQGSAHSTGAVWDLLSDTRLRPLVIAFTVLHVAQQLGGINAVFYYSNSFFEGVIDDPLVGTCLCGVINVLATYAALKLMDSVGRVKLLMASLAGMMVCCVFITGVLLDYMPSSVALVAVMGFVGFFEFGLGPIPWLVVAEMFDAKYVATAMSIACQINWGCNFIVGIGFPYLQAGLGPWSFGPFFIVLTACFLYVAFKLPETSGRTVAEVQRMVQPMDEDDDYYRGTKGGGNGMQYVVVEGVDLTPEEAGLRPQAYR